MNSTVSNGNMIRRLQSTASVEEIIAAYTEDGCAILEGVISQDQVKALNDEVDPYLRDTLPGGPAGNTTPVFYGVNTKRIEMVPTRSRTFREQVLDLELLYKICDAIFLKETGTYWLGLAQVIEIGPGTEAQPLHRDIQSNPAIMQLGPSGPETLLNFFIALTEFTDENGATRIAPGSHKAGDGAGFSTWQASEGSDSGGNMTVPAVMKAGDVALYSGRTLHGGGANRTKDNYRRGIAMPIQSSFLTPVEAFPLTLGIELARNLPKRVQSILGFRTQYPIGSTGIWRAQAGELAEHLGI